MKVLRVLNNNIVLSRDPSGSAVILTGSGLGFRARPGDAVDPAKISQTFVPADGRDPDHLAQLLAELHPGIARAVLNALRQVDEKLAQSVTLVVAIADHIAGAAARRASGDDEPAYPLEPEVRALYPQELDRARTILRLINDQVEQPLEDSEATAIALHLVNASFAHQGDLAFTYRMTGVIQQMLAVIESRFGVELEQSTVNTARFITHVRYLFARIQQGKQLEEVSSVIGQSIRDAYPEAVRVAEQLASIVSLRFGESLTADEVSYLALHVARITTSAEAVQRA
ncbi:PRD domain-containing protein [Helcobacillus massiliensis]|uniref:Beta-glucoside operon transcriptional antiterminator n=1 Tax=Helcobacillus massiliensis TaxID=521392 RepID=A0A839QQY2_9MICO|nr:PRD domain-containing protein [Helcobacillus massiliensis]MBB3022068.1 beta-glucoside operon transcriptional antiterminator [Helcobacillus massiliensis]